VVQVIIESIHPPVAIADVYQRVVTASINKNVIITNAGTDAQKRLIDAEQLRKTATDYAKAEQYNRESAAENEMAVYYAAMDAYKIHPEAYKLTRALNTYEAMINGNKVYVFSPGMIGYISKFVIGRTSNIIELNK
jgi:regulator of protease activity HflC (stomatin/prohibitin superfamily)